MEPMFPANKSVKQSLWSLQSSRSKLMKLTKQLLLETLDTEEVQFSLSSHQQQLTENAAAQGAARSVSDVMTAMLEAAQKQPEGSTIRQEQCKYLTQKLSESRADLDQLQQAAEELTSKCSEAVAKLDGVKANLVTEVTDIIMNTAVPFVL